MSVVITGGNGLVGAEVVQMLGAAGERLTIVGRGPARTPRPLSARYVEMDLLDPGALTALVRRERPRLVLHAAAMTDVDACESNPELADAINHKLVADVATACRDIEARLVALSTDYVFDGEAGPYRETDSPNPRSAYARSKRLGEEAALALCSDVVVARVAVIYSGRPNAKRTFAVGAVENLVAGKPVRAFVDQFVSPTLAENAAQMCIGAAKTAHRGILHCAGADVMSRVEFCHALADRVKAPRSLVVPVRLAEMNLPAPRPMRCGLIVEQAKALLGSDGPWPMSRALDRFFAQRAGESDGY